MHLPADLPEVHADRLQLVMMFDNLIDNGLKFNVNTPPEVWMCIDEGLDWRIEVQDNGIGIDERYHQQVVFELFRRLNHQDDYPGAGTGLNLVRRIVEDHRGHHRHHQRAGRRHHGHGHPAQGPMLLTLPGIRVGVAGT
ncbi:MAG: ATP-binding protein [bacterium]